MTDALREPTLNVALLLRVTTCEIPLEPTLTVPQLKLSGDTLMVVPVPLKLTVCGLVGALSVIVIVPVGVPAPVGVKVTEIVQLALALRLEPQLLVWTKTLLAIEILVMLSVAFPLLVRVTV